MDDLLTLLRQALRKPQAKFHPDQEEAIQAVLRPPHRALVVEATGWGKSMVYFLATKVLRDRGKGPTLVVSPLLSLMRNQVEAANNLSLRAELYTSDNTARWEEIRQDLVENKIDLLLISPERLANQDFQKFIATSSLSKVGLLVIDEAHCISDWGHDFRPDYRRLGQLIRGLPSSTAVLATTATANDRVVQDILDQIGSGVVLIRGSLARKSLRIQTISGFSVAERFAWLDSHLHQMTGSGIIYTLTVPDADRVAAWLKGRGHKVEAYHSRLSLDHETNRNLRMEREEALLKNEVKALVSTVALGMGFDKPDLGFVIHYQSPGNLVAYYQQIGRAGRAIKDALAVLFMGGEDQDIHQFFIDEARPSKEEVEAVLGLLEAADSGLSIPKIMEGLDVKFSKIERVLKVLLVASPSLVVKVGSAYQRTPNPYVHDCEQDEALRKRRLEERARFEAFATSPECSMELVRKELDDPRAAPCGRCSNCVGTPLIPVDYTKEAMQAAQRFLSQSEFIIDPRKQWKSGSLPQYDFSGNIKSEHRCDLGLCLSSYGDPGLGTWVKKDKMRGHFRDELVHATVEALSRSMPDLKVEWVTAVPSNRSHQLVPDFARRVAKKLGVPYVDAIQKVGVTAPQKEQRNSFHQASNLDGAFRVENVKPGAVLLVDDMVDSQWTFTIVGALLRRAGAAAVTPLALTSTRSRGDDE